VELAASGFNKQHQKTLDDWAAGDATAAEQVASGESSSDDDEGAGDSTGEESGEDEEAVPGSTPNLQEADGDGSAAGFDSFSAEVHPQYQQHCHDIDELAERLAAAGGQTSPSSSSLPQQQQRQSSSMGKWLDQQAVGIAGTPAVAACVEKTEEGASEGSICSSTEQDGEGNGDELPKQRQWEQGSVAAPSRAGTDVSFMVSWLGCLFLFVHLSRGSYWIRLAAAVKPSVFACTVHPVYHLQHTRCGGVDWAG
jgi:hypothetical protein